MNLIAEGLKVQAATVAAEREEIARREAEFDGHIAEQKPLPTDDELGLTREAQQWNAGARIADDCRCRGCGARGYRSMCPTCEKG